MANVQVIFHYTAEHLTRLEQTLSTDRLTPYMTLANGNKEHAIKLYEWNTALSESFYGLLQGLEIALRNAMHSALSAGLLHDNWYDHFALSPDQRGTVEKAKDRIKRDGKLIRPGKLVAELTFGFWVSLTGPAYAQTLWDKHLHKAFSINLRRKTAHARLDTIRKFRNRVAHHESILGRNLKNDFSLIIETLHWICPVTAAWLKSTNSFHPRYERKPQPKKPDPAEDAS